MYRFFYTALLILLAFGAPSRALAAPPQEAGPTADDIASVFLLARTMKAGLNCVAVESGGAAPPENVAAAAEFGNIASMYAFAAAHYPKEGKGDRVSQINDLIDEATLTYQRAYECNPGLQSALYLHRAIDLLRARVDQLTPEDERAQQFSARITELQSRLPSPPPCPACQAHRACPTCSDRPPATGYRGRYAQRLALGVGIGGGQMTFLSKSRDIVDHFTARISFGSRFVLGQRGRHIFGAGLNYAVHAISRVNTLAPARPSTIYQVGPYLEYGFAPLSMLSLHVNVGLPIVAGSVWFPDGADPARRRFHALSVGGGGALCTLHMTLCARVQGYGSILGSSAITGYDVTLHLDFFRLADTLIARRAARSGRSG